MALIVKMCPLLFHFKAAFSKTGVSQSYLITLYIQISNLNSKLNMEKNSNLSEAAVMK